MTPEEAGSAPALPKSDCEDLSEEELKALASSILSHPQFEIPSRASDEQQSCFVHNGQLGSASWLAEHPAAEFLQDGHIKFAGILRPDAPLSLPATLKGSTQLFSCISGAGEILVDGAWRQLEAGESCLIHKTFKPAFHPDESSNWRFAWISFAGSRSATGSLHPRGGSAWEQIETQPQQLFRAIQGLWSEAKAGNTTPRLNQWLQLVKAYSHPALSRGDDRTWGIWNEVAVNPGEDWTLSKLAAMADVSSEHLRRLCKQELGRSPMQQVAMIRMNRACHLLTTTSDKVATIAQEVGYRSSFAFSKAFKKLIGKHPSEYRES